MKFMPKTFFILLFFVCATFSFAQTDTADCPAIACNDNIQISLDNNCSGVTVDMLLEGGFSGAFKIFVTGEDGKTVQALNDGTDGLFYNEDGTLFSWAPYVGETINFTIVSECDGNSCWGEANLEINQLPSLNSPCEITPGALIEEVISYEDLFADGSVTFTYPITDATCQIPATVTHSGDFVYACSAGDDGDLGTSDDGWCTVRCEVTDDLAGTITVTVIPSEGDLTGIAIPSNAACKVVVHVPDCTPCNVWCSESDSRSYPEGFIMVDQIYEMVESGCFANIEGDITVIEDVKGDACSSITTVSYYARVNLHGETERVLLLEQGFTTEKLDHDVLNAPGGPVILDCGSVSQDALPQEIFTETGSGTLAYPFFFDEHTSVPNEIEICGLDHFEVVVDTMEQLVEVEVDTDKDGIPDDVVWVLLPVVQKDLMDSVYCETVTLATDGGIIVMDEDGKCLGDGTDFILTNEDNDPVVITSPPMFKGNGAIAPGSSTCDIATTDAIVTIENGRYCNLIVSYSDQGPFEACGSGFKIIRNWQALDWCDATIGSYVLGSQFIEVIDTEPPVLPELLDAAVSIDPWVCTAKFPLLLPTAEDGCEGTTISFDIDVSAGRYDAESGFIVDLYPEDDIEIIVEVSDDCFNVALDTFSLTVFDGVAPVPVCHENIVVTLTTGGIAKIYAEDFDAGSHDAGCGEVEVFAARITGCCDDECAGGDEVCLEYDKFGDCVTFGANPEMDEYGEFVKFCCEDAGTSVMVAILTVDAAGNRNTCMVEATVVDKSAVTLACEDLTIACDADLNELSSASTVAAVCEGGTPDMLSETINETGCGTGTIIREWWIDRDASGDLTQGDAYCEQTITILPSEGEAFDPLTIKWPRHYTGEVFEGINFECDDDGEFQQFDNERVPMGDVFSCSSAELEDRPYWCDSPCGLVGFSVEEETVVASDACLKIIKRWTVIDWCTWDPNGTNPVDDANDTDNDSFVAVADWTDPSCFGCEENQPGSPYYFRYTDFDPDGYYTFDQVIVVVDDSDPTISAPETYTQSTDGGATSKEDDTLCTGEGTVSASAADSCGGEESAGDFLSWTINRYENGELVATKNATGEEVTMSTGEGSPGDMHRIVWITSDGCGNSAEAETMVTFGDDVPPTPLCVSGVTTAFMESNGQVAIWASDFDLGSFDNCTSLDFTIVPSGAEPAQPGTEEFEEQRNYTLRCDDVTNFIEFNVYVWDANGLGDFCTVGVLVGGECNPSDDGSSGFLVAGSIQTENGDLVNGVLTTIESNELEEFPKTQTTGNNGQYAFASTPEGFNYTISVDKNDNHLNGVSTLDLVLMQKHILGIEEFTTAYKTIAADANNDGRISALDLIALRELILGRDLELANNTSWRFTPANQSIFDVTNPLPFTESIELLDLSENSLEEDFIGIKIGDVNGNASANSLQTGEVRTAGHANFVLADEDVDANQLVAVPVTANDFNNVYGFQFTMNLNGLSYVGIEQGSIDVSAANLADFGDHLTMSWESSEAITTAETLFTLVFKATEDVTLSNAIDVNSEKTSSELYKNESLDVFNLDVAFTTEIDASFTVLQNEPNPFNDQTTIGFVLPERASTTIQIVNAAGTVVSTETAIYDKGFNQKTLNRSDINLATGIYYYTIESSNQSASKKMIVVNE